MDAMDELSNITGNFSDELVESQVPLHERIFLELFTLVALLSLAANSLLIFVIVKYKKLRKDATNVIFLHVNILQAVYFFSAPLTWRTAIYFFLDSPVHFTVFCALFQIEACVGAAIIGFLFLLICDSYLKIYYKEKYRKFCRIYKFFIIVIYILMLCTCTITVNVCFGRHMFAFTYVFIFFAICVAIAILIIIDIIHVFRKRKLTNYKDSNIGLVVANFYFLLWTPCVIFLLTSFIRGQGGHITLILLFVLGFTSPIFNLIYVYCCDNNFNVFLRQVFTCRCKEYKNEDLEDQSVVYSDVNGVQINAN
ncbi:kappa-type opioid receptor-like [Tribolium madens]|uniref:kappa-type opioid receptor-like n=1 Tax=Tribolium madens TaxID=41895 RepID=UPI001CF76194|nr:kappa-type opioid receptor-like [Tribolium madens]